MNEMNEMNELRKWTNKRDKWISLAVISSIFSEMTGDSDFFYFHRDQHAADHHVRCG